MFVRTVIALACAHAALVPIAATAAPDGLLDTTFDQDGRQIVAFDRGYDNWDQVSGMAVLSDGRVLLAGRVESDPEQIGIGLARLNANGQVDETFGKPWYLPGNLVYANPVDAALQPDGKLLVAAIASDGELVQGGAVCRFLPDGSPDTGFGHPDEPVASACRLIVANAVLTSVLIQTDGRIVVAGNTTDPVAHGLVVRLDAQGNYDDSFGTGGAHVLLPNSVHPTYLNDIAQAPDGDLLAVGHAAVNNNYGWQVFRLRGDDGELDTDFDGDGLKPVNFDLVPAGFDFATGVHVLPNGSILVGGEAGAGVNGSCPAVVRLTPAGGFDGALDGDGQYADAFCSSNLNVTDMLVQTDGRIVLAGDVVENFMALRITPDGQRDATFGVNGLSTVELGPAHGIPLAKDRLSRVASQGGRLLLAGYTDPFDTGQRDFAITRLDNDLIFADDLE